MSQFQPLVGTVRCRRPKGQLANMVWTLQSFIWLSILLAAAGCGFQEPDLQPETEDESWAVTAWGDLYEIFPEVDLLTVGETSLSHTHVTLLKDFSPMVEGRVEIILSGGGGDQVFATDELLRAGIYNVEITPKAAGDFDLSFRITTPSGAETIEGGRVRVAEMRADEGGGLLAEPRRSPTLLIGTGEPSVFSRNNSGTPTSRSNGSSSGQ